MKAGDAFTTDMHALVTHMETDTRFTTDEMAGLVAVHAVYTASGDTTKEQDALIVHCLKKYICQNENY